MSDVAFGAHGFHFAIDADPALLDRVQAAMATLRTDRPPSSRYALSRHGGHIDVSFDGEPIGERATEDDAILLLHWHVNQQVIDASVAARTTMHAAAARSPAGHGVLLAAPMESGKTTTVTAMLKQGWDFLSDEAVGVDPDGTMHAYPKPLTLDRGSWPIFPELEPNGISPTARSWLVPVTALGVRVVATAPLRLAVLPAYEPGRATSLERLVPSEAALALARSTFQFDSHGERDLRVVARVARQVPVYRLTVAQLDEAVQLLLDLEQGVAAA